MRRTPWFDRCLDWIFEAYTHATAREDVRAYLSRHPDLDDVLVKMIVQIRTRVAHDIRLDALVVHDGARGEYLEVTARQVPLHPGFDAAIQEIWDEQIGRLSGQSGWIALLAEDWVPAPSAPAARAKSRPGTVKTLRQEPAWSGAN